MSFGTYARKVRDHSLPYGRRINALAGCIERYQPIGFLATFGYLEQVAGPLRRDETALLRALDALGSSRDLWLVELSAYAERRREAKLLGRRSPRKTELNVSSPVCWYGDSKGAAIFTVRFLLENRDREVDADVVRLASVCLEAGGDFSSAEHDQLSRLRRHFEHLRRVSGWPDVDWPNWRKAHRSLWLLHHITYATASDDACSGAARRSVR
ncbi:hypothetical protein [Micromonospora sp. CV4]|uniref:hypothetical protein n=1 Tax=Micromonospora sp. CV4 TaxID=2478711 RepID=UPI000EF4880A|nr:hypothetical protein [Micromonospora sp. CV4]RLP95869.1 hypothetical protein EAD98_12300 [Micromonospora sp. CV4]